MSDTIYEYRPDVVYTVYVNLGGGIVEEIGGVVQVTTQGNFICFLIEDNSSEIYSSFAVRGFAVSPGRD